MHKESKTVQIGINHYCVYCGDKVKQDSEYWGDNEFTYYHYCDSCELGKEEILLHEEIAQIVKKHGGYEKFKENSRIVSKLKYESELASLNNRYKGYI